MRAVTVVRFQPFAGAVSSRSKFCRVVPEVVVADSNSGYVLISGIPMNTSNNIPVRLTVVPGCFQSVALTLKEENGEY
jgi:hypothetical protein